MIKRISQHTPNRQKRYLRRTRQLTMVKLSALLSGLVIFAWLSTWFIGQPAHAATTWTVSKIADTNDGSCDGDCSLREAIAAASTGDTIVFSSLFDSPQIITLDSTAGFRRLDINKGLTIVGKGADKLTIRRLPGDLFSIFAVSGTSPVELIGMTITGGNSDSTGGIINTNTPLTIRGCHIQGNKGCSSAGGITNLSGTLTLRNSAVTGNARPCFGSDEGGGIENSGTLNVINSTISGNSARSGAGGIRNASGTTTLTHATISNNATETAFTGGVRVFGGSVIVRNSIIAHNIGFESGNDVTGAFTSEGYNVISTTSGSTGFGSATDFINTSAGLNSLGFYGGATPTHSLQTGSVAIDKGGAIGGETRDQRGLLRVNYLNIPDAVSGGDGSDIGAFEYGPLVLNNNDAGGGSLRQAILDAPPASGEFIQFDPAYFSTPRTITLTTGALVIQKNLSILGPGANLLTVSGNHASTVISIPIVNPSVKLSGITISEGSADIAGGIDNRGTLEVNACAISGNAANTYGGILSTGTLRLNASTVSGNVATGNIEGVGGIGAAGTVFITNSTISGNTKTGADTNAGGLRTLSGSVTTITNTTITNNTGGGPNSAGGIYQSAGTITVRNTIVAANVNNTTTPDVVGSFVSSGFNLIGNRGSVTNFNQTGDQTGTSGAPLDPQLGSLANNGGPTQTHSLNATSPARESGANALALDPDNNALSFDQRGTGFARIVGPRVDIGAVEPPLNNPPTISDITDKGTTVNTPTGSIPFIVGDVESSAGTLTVSGASSNQTLVPNGNFVFGGSGANRVVIITPAANQTGTSTITISVSDGSSITSDTFLLSVSSGFVVRSTGDADHNQCAADCTLRDALTQANNNPGLDTITFAVTGVIQITNELPGLGSVTINGPGANQLTVRRANTGLDSGSYYRIFSIVNGATVAINGIKISGGDTLDGKGILNDGNLTLADCIIADNVWSNEGGIQRGGGIYNSGTLVLNHTTVLGNYASDGGGIYSTGPLTLNDSTVGNNFVFGQGGGIFQIGQTLNVNNSTVVGNGKLGVFGANVGTANSGGGIRTTGATLNLTGSTLSDNLAQSGGGLYFATGGNATITNTTFSGNRATGAAGSAGGGISNETGIITMANTTLATNVVDHSGGTSGQGGGIRNATGLFHIRNSIVAGNSGNPSVGRDIAGTFDSQGHNLVGEVGISTGWVASDLLNQAAVLGPLQDNAGKTKTHALLPGSPAINAGDPCVAQIGGCLGTALVADQRGYTRFGVVDIGAYEQQLIVTNTNDSNAGSLRDAILNANGTPGLNAIEFAITSPSPWTIQLTTALPALSDSVSLVGPGANLLTVRRNAGNFRIFSINSGATVTLSGMTVSNGNDYLACTGGGGIRNSGTLIVDQSAVSHNHGCTSGSGIYNEGSLTVNNSTISSNGVGDGGAGGGIYNKGTLSVASSTISGNGGPSITGGALYQESGATTITSSTLANNSTYGVRSVSGTVSARNTIFAGNSDADFNGTLSSLGYNLVQNTTSLTVIGTTTGNKLGVNPKLSSLQFNGGTTQTQLLLPGSPAIDAGQNSNTPASDQRGFSRLITSTIDIGAVEVSYAIAATGGTPQSAGISASFATRLQATVTESGIPAQGIPVTFNAPNSGSSGAFGGQLSTTVTTLANGVATAPAFTANLIDGDYLVTATTGIPPTADFNLTNINNPSTDVQLSNTTMAENLPAGTVVGTFSTVDPDAGETFTYRQFGGPGTEDHFRFTIDGNALKTTQVLDYETNPVLHIGVCSDDLEQRETCKLFVINLTDTFEPPTNITLSPASVPENSPSGTVVGNLSTSDLDPGDSFTYSLVPGPGDDDNSSFSIAGAVLKTNAVFNFEVKSAYSIRLRTVDTHGLEFQRQQTVTVTDIDEFVTITVNSLADDAMPGNGACTLREALLNSGLTDTTGGDCTAGAGNIRRIIFSVTGIIDLTTALPEAVNVGVNGPGANLLRVRRSSSAPDNFSVFTTSGVTTLSGLTISGGTGVDIGGYTIAGGIRNNGGELTVMNSVITGNTAYIGGGITSFAALKIINSLVNNNGSSGGGGAIDACGTFTVDVINSTLTGNSGTQGGAIHLDCNGTTVNITNSTISHNPGHDGGGIFNRGQNTVNLRNSIVAGNTGGLARNLSGAFISLGHNLIGSIDSSSGFTVGLANANGDKVGDNSAPIDPLLTTLDNHGGPTFTRALRVGSLALAAGDICVTQPPAGGGCLTTPLTTDQRGLPRLFNSAVDIGAVQRQATESLSAAAGSPLVQQFANLSLTFSGVSAAGTTSVEQITAGAAGGLPGGFSLCPTCPTYNIFTSATYAAPITLCFSVPSITNNAVFNQLRILHGEGNPSVLVDRTSSSDFTTKTICGVVNSLSPFTVAQSPSAPTAAPASISGSVNRSDGTPLGGVSVNLSGGKASRTITDGNGQYRFDNIEANGFYTVTPGRANYSFSPANRSFSLVGNKSDAVFTASAAAQTENPLHSGDFFVRQQYLDFLGREPDQAGWLYWSDQIAACGGDTDCANQKRLDVSAAFFMSAEFQRSGDYIYRIYRAGLARQITYVEFTDDHPKVIGGPILEPMRTQFADQFVQRSDFVAKYQNAVLADTFVDALLQATLVDTQIDLSSHRASLIAAYNSAGNNDGDMNHSRSAVLRTVAELPEFKTAVYNSSFVQMEFFGYLKRDPDERGYHFWLDVMNNQAPGTYRAMVCSFLTSAEYQNRFSSVVLHQNSQCGP